MMIEYSNFMNKLTKITDINYGKYKIFKNGLNVFNNLIKKIDNIPSYYEIQGDFLD